jgi:hypothetical protein
MQLSRSWHLATSCGTSAIGSRPDFALSRGAQWESTTAAPLCWRTWPAPPATGKLSQTPPPAWANKFWGIANEEDGVTAEGAWVVLGAVVGALSSGLTTWLTLRGQPDYFDELAMKFFREQLRKPEKLKTAQLLALGKKIGLKEYETGQILLLCGGEPRDDHWELVRRPPAW